jgi:hypothetical protein
MSLIIVKGSYKKGKFFYQTSSYKNGRNEYISSKHFTLQSHIIFLNQKDSFHL